MKRLVLLFIISLLFVGSISAQSAKALRQAKKREKQAIKKQAEKKKEMEADIEFLQQKHLANQSKEVRKRMKKSKKAANKTNANKKTLFPKGKIKKKRKLKLPFINKNKPS